MTRYEPHHDKTNKMACVPSEDSNQPGHLPRLIRIFAADQSLRCPLEESVGPKLSSRQRRLISRKDSDQPPTLIRVFAARLIRVFAADQSLRCPPRLIRVFAADESLRCPLEKSVGP